MNDKLPAIDSTTHACDSCGVTVVGHRLCGNPQNPLCAADETYAVGFDLGYERGWDARLDLDLALDLDDIREVMRVLVEALDRRIAEAKQPKPSRGRIEFEGSSIELADEGDVHDPRD